MQRCPSLDSTPADSSLCVIPNNQTPVLHADYSRGATGRLGNEVRETLQQPLLRAAASESKQGISHCYTHVGLLDTSLVVFKVRCFEGVCLRGMSLKVGDAGCEVWTLPSSGRSFQFELLPALEVAPPWWDFWRDCVLASPLSYLLSCGPSLLPAGLGVVKLLLLLRSCSMHLSVAPVCFQEETSQGPHAAILNRNCAFSPSGSSRARHGKRGQRRSTHGQWKEVGAGCV